MIFQTKELENAAVTYLPSIKVRTQAIYLILCFMVLLALCLMPFLYTDISIKSQGIIRPDSERTEIKPLVSGIIDTIYAKEGQFVKKDEIIVRLRDIVNSPKELVNAFEIKQRNEYIHDLGILTTSLYLTDEIISALQSPLYKQQVSQFIYQRTDQEASIKKVSNEVRIDSSLVKDRVLAAKDLFDKQIERDKLQASYRAFKNQQYGAWEQDLAKYKLELSQYYAQQKQINTDKQQLEIRAPVSGIIQGINTRYSGGNVQANESFCVISPETKLVAECYVSTQDVGLLKIGQETKFQIDAFDYNHFGILTGQIIDIDNDFTTVDDKPVFKVHCSFDQQQLYLKNGFAGHLKKGLTLQSRFVVSRRSLWQLMFDKIDDWINPVSPEKKGNFEQKN